jgi:hypothetical protein
MKKNVFLGLFLLMMGKAYSQIVYTPVNPNFEINLSPTGGSSANLFPIDFNNDGVVDFNFRWDVFGPALILCISPAPILSLIIPVIRQLVPEILIPSVCLMQCL